MCVGGGGGHDLPGRDSAIDTHSKSDRAMNKRCRGAGGGGGVERDFYMVLLMLTTIDLLAGGEGVFHGLAYYADGHRPPGCEGRTYCRDAILWSTGGASSKKKKDAIELFLPTSCFCPLCTNRLLALLPARGMFCVGKEAACVAFVFFIITTTKHKKKSTCRCLSSKNSRNSNRFFFFFFLNTPYVPHQVEWW